MFWKIPLANAGTICRALRRLNQRRRLERRSCQYSGGVAAQDATLRSSLGEWPGPRPAVTLGFWSAPALCHPFQALEETVGLFGRGSPPSLSPPTLQSCVGDSFPSDFTGSAYLLMPSDAVAFVVDPSGTVCPPVFWLPAARLSGTASLSPGRTARGSEPCEEEAVPGAEGRQWAAGRGMLCRLRGSSQCSGGAAS